MTNAQSNTMTWTPDDIIIEKVLYWVHAIFAVISGGEYVLSEPYSYAVQAASMQEAILSFFASHQSNFQMWEATQYVPTMGDNITLNPQLVQMPGTGVFPGKTASVRPIHDSWALAWVVDFGGTEGMLGNPILKNDLATDHNSIIRFFDYGVIVNSAQGYVALDIFTFEKWQALGLYNGFLGAPKWETYDSSSEEWTTNFEGGVVWMRKPTDDQQSFFPFAFSPTLWQYWTANRAQLGVPLNDAYPLSGPSAATTAGNANAPATKNMPTTPTLPHITQSTGHIPQFGPMTTPLSQNAPTDLTSKMAFTAAPAHFPLVKATLTTATGKQLSINKPNLTIGIQQAAPVVVGSTGEPHASPWPMLPNNPDPSLGYFQVFSSNTLVITSTQYGVHVVKDEIVILYNAMHGVWSILGVPVTDVIAINDSNPDLIGKYMDFEHGSIFWSAATAAYYVIPEIVSAWRSMDGLHLLGYPKNHTTDEPSGRFNWFEHGSLHWNAQTGQVTRSM